MEQSRQAQMQEGEEEFQATKASRRNERKKEQRREKAEQQEATPVEVAAAPAQAAPVQKKVAPKEKKPPTEEKEGGARQRAVEKKLRQIADLEAKQAQGEELNEDQCAKVGAKKDLEAELKSLISGIPREAPVQEAAPKAAVAAPAVVEQAKTAVEVVEEKAVEEPPKAEAPKSKKAIEKKLRQIAELEEKQAKGEELNPDQLSKLGQKKELQRELKTAV